MEKTITIRNLKHIRELTFNLPNAGVHLLAGCNGAGKTSVLACLRRIGYPNAFAHHFPSSQHSEALDNFQGAEVMYTLGDRKVTYSYRGERWAPSPRSNSNLLEQFGYPAVLYIGATADRITPRPEDFKMRNVRPASSGIKDTANRILGTKKFDALKTINLTRGAGNPAFVLEVSPTPKPKYVSERHFSLGELCVLKLARMLTTCEERSLVLIDELELALHPKAQIELLNVLIEISKQKELTVIFSTHSISLLKRIRRQHILILEANQNSGTVTTLTGCFPAYALGNIAYDEERAPDVVIYVEDEAAVYVTTALVNLCIADQFKDQLPFPTVQIVPIGPFLSVVRFLEHSDALLPPSTTSVALLDGDVKEETLSDWRKSQNHTMLAEFERHKGRINYLPWTPEVGLVEFLNSNIEFAEREIRKRFSDNRLSIRAEDISGIPLTNGRTRRQACKDGLSKIVNRLGAQLPNEDEAHIHRRLFEIFSTWYFKENRADVLTSIGPIIR